MNGKKKYAEINNDLYPYLLVNIGTGTSFTMVDGDGKFELICASDIGGGTFWGLGRLLTKCKSFDELLELSQRGNSRVVDMLCGDINGGKDYTKLGINISSTFVASGFGKAMHDDKELECYKPEDISSSLLRMISNNIGQIACLNALQFGLKRIFFSGSFIRGHATMNTISDAFSFWTRGEPKAMFLRHEGFLCAMGTFLKYKKLDPNSLVVHDQMSICQQNGDVFDDQSIDWKRIRLLLMTFRFVNVERNP